MDKINNLTLINTANKMDSSLDILLAHKRALINTFLIEKFKSPKLTNKQICGKIGIAVSSFNRHRKDLELRPFSYYIIPLKSKSHSKNKDISKLLSPQEVIPEPNMNDVITEKKNTKKITSSSKIKGGYKDPFLFDQAKEENIHNTIENYKSKKDISHHFPQKIIKTDDEYFQQAGEMLKQT